MRVRNSQNDPLDFCSDCAPTTEKSAREIYAGQGEGPDGRGDCFVFDDDHPDYAETDYTCFVCGAPLQEEA